jgi:hypothetical protein
MSNLQPPIRAVPLMLYPAMGTLREVVDYADSKVPGISKNEMFSVLMTYHNTLLKVIQEQNKS